MAVPVMKKGGLLKLQKITNLLKDQVSLGLAMSKVGKIPQIEAAVLRAINHEERVPDEDSLQAVLQIGRSSRMKVAHCVCLIMDRLSRTHSWIVSLKCLITIHRCIYEGGFMFQDQFSIHPSHGGRNYLNLSKFKDSTSPFTWHASSWIRWYARFIERWIQTSISTGDFMDSTNTGGRMALTDPEKLKGLLTAQLIRDIMSLHGLLQEVCGWEDEGQAGWKVGEEEIMNHPLVKEALRLINLVVREACRGLKLRMNDVQARSKLLQQSQAVELLNVCVDLSRESINLTHFFEVCSEKLTSHGNHHDDVSGEVIITDYELMKLKEIFAATASARNVTAITRPQLAVPYGSLLRVSSVSPKYQQSSTSRERLMQRASMSDLNMELLLL